MEQTSLTSKQSRQGGSSAEKSQYLAPLDAVRGLTAVMLIVLHYTTASFSFDPPYIPLPFPYPLNELTQFMLAGTWGLVGVLVFFSISGFVFMWHYYGPLSRHELQLGTFALYRFSRLYPLAWVTSFFMFILYIFEHLFAGGGYPLPAMIF